MQEPHTIEKCNEEQDPAELTIINFQIVPDVDNVNIGVGKLASIQASLKCWFDFQAKADISFDSPRFRGGIYWDHKIAIIGVVGFREYVLLSTTSFMNGKPTKQKLLEFP